MYLLTISDGLATRHIEPYESPKHAADSLDSILASRPIVPDGRLISSKRLPIPRISCSHRPFLEVDRPQTL